MIERGTVVSAGEGHADIMILPTEKCGECEFCTEGAGGRRVLEGAVDPIGVAAGDTVEVETPTRVRHTAQFLVFVVPVLALVVGYLAGYVLALLVGIDPDTVGAACAMVFAAVAFLGLRRVRFKAADGSDEMPRVRAIIARGQDSPSGDSEGL